jgi:formylglycine-generating enzyme required for sulfatase activity
MWEEVMGSNPACDYGVGDDYPVYYVSWYDCRAFVDAMNVLDSVYTYRLPTEAEWEYACRAGTGTAYYWGGTMDGSFCWYADNSDGAAHPEGQKQANAWGLYDMSGNVWEWCEDVYTIHYEECPADGSAYTGSSSGRVERGGSWSGVAQCSRSSFRCDYSPGYSYYSLGLRLARSER